MTAHEVQGAASAGSRREYSNQDKSLKSSYQAKVYNPTGQKQSKLSVNQFLGF